MDDRNDLAQQLRDERARRREAEQRIADLTERAELWRQRAEERSERIDRLVARENSKTNTARQWLKALRREHVEPSQPSEPAVDTPTSGHPAEVSTPWPTSKATAVVSVVHDEGISRVLDTFDTSPLSGSDESDLHKADLVVVEPAALRSLPSDALARLGDWMRQTGRQPLVAWLTSEDRSALDDMDPGEYIETRMTGSFDPATHRPSGNATAEVLDASAPLDIELIEKAASGTGFDQAPGAGTAARRWAYRHHAPWVKARALLELAGVPARDPIPAVAAILVSHRPESIPASLEAILRQTHRPAELVVGVHGSPITADIEKAVEEADIPAAALSLDRELSLGECLNQTAAESSAPLIAKIDDDDRYGPAHLEDSFHALCYSGADIVGKGAHYTYVADTDSTVLRRPGLEETFIDGSVNGATLVVRREVWDRVGFPHRPRHVDTGFLRAARVTGASVYATSRWEFCYVRRAKGHTWDAEKEVFLAGSEPAWDGFQPERTEVADVELG